MSKSIGVVMAERVEVALIEDHKIITLREYPEDSEEFNGLVEIPSEDLCDIICNQIVALVPEAGRSMRWASRSRALFATAWSKIRLTLANSRARGSATGSRRR